MLSQLLLGSLLLLLLVFLFVSYSVIPPIKLKRILSLNKRYCCHEQHKYRTTKTQNAKQNKIPTHLLTKNQKNKPDKLKTSPSTKKLAKQKSLFHQKNRKTNPEKQKINKNNLKNKKQKPLQNTKQPKI